MFPCRYDSVTFYIVYKLYTALDKVDVSLCYDSVTFYIVYKLYTALDKVDVSLSLWCGGKKPDSWRISNQPTIYIDLHSSL